MAKWLVATGLLYCNPLLARGGSHTGSIIEDLIMLAFFWLVLVPLYDDKVKDNNAIANLRDASRSQNACNYDASNKHGYRGVVKMRNGYGAFIRVKGEKMYLGYRACVIEAAKLYDEAAVNYHGEFATLNFGD